MFFRTQRIPLRLAAGLALASLLGTGAAAQVDRPLPPPAEKAEFIVLCYHTFLGNQTGFTDFSMGAFSAQLDRMEKLGYRFVSLEDAVAGRIEGRNNLVISIDDGNHSVYPAVKEILAPRRIPAFLFIYPGVTGKLKTFLNADQIRELQTLGCGVGAHGWFHEYMTKRAWADNPKKVMMEVSKPGPLIERIIGAPPVHFAYPFGVGAPAAAQELRKAGYRYLYTADAGVVPIPVDALGIIDPGIDMTQIPRTLVTHALLPLMFRKLEENLARP